MNCYYFYTAFDMLCHNFTYKTIVMIQQALGEKIVDIPKIGTIYEKFHIYVKYVGKMYYLCAVKQKTKNDEDSNFKNSRTDRQC